MLKLQHNTFLHEIKIEHYHLIFILLKYVHFRMIAKVITIGFLFFIISTSHQFQKISLQLCFTVGIVKESFNFAFPVAM